VALLPDQSDRDWLLAELAGLVEARGADTLLRTRLLLPVAADFPERFTPDAAGVRTIARRLLDHVGLGRLRPRVTTFTEARPPELGAPSRHEGTAAWFAGIHGDTCELGVDEARLGDAAGLVGALAHEVAHAYRRHHRLEVDDPATEECLTDLTTVYLGLGVLTTAVSHRFSAEQAHERGGVTVRTSHSRLGYLGVQAMAFALAAQLVARAASAGERRAIAKAMGGVPGDCLRAGLASLAPEQVCSRLGLVVDRWTFRHAGHDGRRGLVAGAVLGAGPAGLLVAQGDVGLAAVVLAGVTLVGAAVGRRRRRDRCARCRATVAADSLRCRRCRSLLAATLGLPADDDERP
jgi:hypothetical protein